MIKYKLSQTLKTFGNKGVEKEIDKLEVYLNNHSTANIEK